MTLVHNHKEVDALWPYKTGKMERSKYPKAYPCLVEFEQRDGGLGGDYYALNVVYIPYHIANYIIDTKMFKAGVEAKHEEIYIG